MQPNTLLFVKPLIRIQKKIAPHQWSASFSKRLNFVSVTLDEYWPPTCWEQYFFSFAAVPSELSFSSECYLDSPLVLAEDTFAPLMFTSVSCRLWPGSSAVFLPWCVVFRLLDRATQSPRRTTKWSGFPHPSIAGKSSPGKVHRRMVKSRPRHRLTILTEKLPERSHPSERRKKLSEPWVPSSHLYEQCFERKRYR